MTATSRLDALIAPLHAQGGDALLVEAGQPLVLVKGGENVPLLNARLTNEHVAELLRPAAPPGTQLTVERFEPFTPVEFDYASPSGAVHVILALVADRLSAKITRVVDASGFQASNFAGPRGLEPPTDGGGFKGTGEVTDDDPLASVEVISEGTAAPPPYYDRPAIEEWFDIFLMTRASDLHLTSSLAPMIRNDDGEMRELVEIPTVGPYELEQMLLQIMPPQAREEWQSTRDTDFAYDMKNARLRVNVFCDLRGPAATLRRIPNEVLSVQQLGLPQPVVDLCRLKKGLVLITGPTGSGKSTTLAAMIDWINENRADHIVTVEDPIEYVHTPKRCLIHQRQVGVHTRSYARALRAALREDPNIILVGELRDLETISIAIEMAETGHLVFGTLHTSTAAATVDRIVDAFGAEKQEQVRQMLADTLRGVISQTLCKRTDGGRVLALEILLITTAVANMLREKKAFQIASVIQTSRHMGMRALNDSLIELVKAGVVDANEAIDRAADRVGLKRDMSAAGLMPTSQA